MYRATVLNSHILGAPCASEAHDESRIERGPGVSLVSGKMLLGDSAKVVWAEGTVASLSAFVKYYCGPTRSLVPTGDIYFSTSTTGNQIGMEAHGIEFLHTEVTVRNARGLPDDFFAKGFTLRRSPTVLRRDDFLVHDKIVQTHYSECEALLHGMGAAHVLPFDYITRSMVGKQSGLKVAGAQEVQGAATGVHADYTINGAPRRLEQLAGPLKANDLRMRSLSAEQLTKARNGRWCIINVWRNIRDEPVEKTPLAMCDCTTVSDEDICCLEQRFVDRIGENYMPAFSAQHAWYYYPQAMRDEAILLKAWDSQEGPVSSKCSFHGAFLDPSSPADAYDRESIEVRCFCIF